MSKVRPKVPSIPPRQQATTLPQRARADLQEAADSNLEKIDHIVVVVLENRSFDHMLGYLSLPEGEPFHGRGRDDVDGLKGTEKNVIPGRLRVTAKVRARLEAPEPTPAFEVPEQYRDREFPIFRLDSTVFADNPPHNGFRVSQQIGTEANPMSGFALAFEAKATTLDAGMIMGYYTGDQLFAYDLFAEHFTVCDKWHASMPGPTWPNRMFLYAGTSGGIVNNVDLHVFDEVEGSILNYPPEFDTMPDRLIVDVLSDHHVDWKIYSHGWAWMRLFPKYLAFPRLLSPRIAKFKRFEKDCANQKLPPVCFIDPNFSDAGDEDKANDDQAPTDVVHGQLLVAKIYDALHKHGYLKNTLLIVTYDEHGGFYDHVFPPLAPDHVEGQSDYLLRYGVRVPTMAISAWVPRRSASHMFFDHTSILKTILKRFCPPGTFMTSRVDEANHLGHLLTEEQARTDLPDVRSPAPPGGGIPEAPLRPDEPIEGRPELPRLPDLPGLPNVPGLPDLPGLPNVPGLPDLHQPAALRARNELSQVVNMARLALLRAGVPESEL